MKKMGKKLIKRAIKGRKEIVENKEKTKKK